MPQTILESTSEHIADSAHQASRGTRLAADAIADGAEAVRRAAKQGGDMAEEFLKDTTRRIHRQPILAVATTGVLGLAAGVVVGWMIRRK